MIADDEPPAIAPLFLPKYKDVLIDFPDLYRFVVSQIRRGLSDALTVLVQ